MTKSTQSCPIEQFIERVQWLHEPDYGDFKRKVGLYLSRLEQALGAEASSGNRTDLFKEMKDLVVFAPNGDVESTRLRVLQLAKKL